jgi:anti-sigma factor RsiW
MSCPDKSVLLHGMLDGELDVVGALAFEAHLKECPACAAEYKRQQEIRAALRSPAMRERAPDALRRRIAALAEDAPEPWWRRLLGGLTFSPRQWGGAGAAALVTALALLIVLPRGGDDLERQLIDSHVRSLLANHLTDVLSTDRHTVKPWFAGKLDAAPPVVDLAPQGFPLVGGRLDYLDRRVVAALVYGRREHIINLFVWPQPGVADAVPAPEVDDGYRLIRWSRSGLVFWAVSDMDMTELQSFQVEYEKGVAAQAAATPS